MPGVILVCKSEEGLWSTCTWAFHKACDAQPCLHCFKFVVYARHAFRLIASGIDNHDSGYLGMAVQLYVQAHLGHYHILTQKEYTVYTKPTETVYNLI